ncbi:MAG TPA: glutamate--tRNA ligase family protein, partial [bacterium]|nr:glutamate--tRNA ligase family protein [bacterium]
AFGWDAPRFAHLPMILAPDRTKLSKRHGATSVVEFKNLGYLPEAIVNFVALMGWNPKDEREIFSLEDLVKEFKIENVNKAPAIFNIEKLNSINERYIQNQISVILSHMDDGHLDNGQRTDYKKYLGDFGVTELTTGELELLGRGGFKTLKEAAEYILSLRKEIDYSAEMLIFRKSNRETTLKALQQVNKSTSQLEANAFGKSEELQKMLEEIVQLNGLTNGDVFWPVRVALSGEEKSPSPVELMVALGKEESLKRIKKAIEKLNTEL